MIELCNTLGMDAWFTLPHRADDDYIRNFARMVKAQLNPEASVFVEHSNEVWNWRFSQAKYADREAAKDSRRFGRGGPAYLKWHAARSTRIFGIWTEVFGDSDRMIRVLAGQSANAWSAKQMLEFENTPESIDAWAIAPYFGGKLGERAASLDLDALMDLLRTEALPETERDVLEHAALARRFGVDLIAYEGGQHLVAADGKDEATNRLLNVANRDPRMGAIYLDYLRMWKRAGGKLFAHFNHIGTYGRSGRWGARESYAQPREAAPKYDALMKFQEQNQRWW
jgi:hypothetical protein